MTGNIDGNFKITSGSNFTKAFAEELGLTKEERKKLGSVWNQIYEKCGGVHELNNVRTGQEFKFDKNVMNEILSLVNDKLGTNKQLKETKEEGTTTESSPKKTQESTNKDKGVKPHIKTQNHTQQQNVSGAEQKFEKAKAEAEELSDSLKTAIKNNSLEDFASGNYKVHNDIDDYSLDAIAVALKGNSEEVQLLLKDMADSRKINLMKKLDPNFKGVEINDADLINAAKSYTARLEGNASAEKINKAAEKEENRQANIKNFSNAHHIKLNSRTVYNAEQKKLDSAKNEALRFKTALEEARKENDIEDFAGGDNWFSKDIDDFQINGIALALKENTENIKIMLKDMADSRKINLMKKLDPNFKGVEINDTDLIKAAQKFSDKLESDAKAKANSINSVSDTYNSKMKDIANLYYPKNPENVQKKIEFIDNKKVVTVSDGERTITVQFAPGNYRIEKITMDDLSVTYEKGNKRTIKQNNTSIDTNSNFDNLRNYVEEIITKAKLIK